MKISEINEGMNLPEIKKPITQENINLYAEASQDFNPIHIDPEFAKQTPLGGTIAHGMLTLSYVSQVMTDIFGRSWISNGILDVRFKTPARPGDTITISGKISKLEKSESETIVNCEVLCANQKGEPVILGETKVRLMNNENSN
jgi:3-hydroxybutyryl-CoA dehydratase